MNTTTSSTESVADRITRLALTATSDSRRESLTIAHAIVSDAIFARIGNAIRCARKSTVALPASRLEGLSRGRGWARKGSGDSAVWGAREKGGYRVGPGRWVIGGNDGFARKEETVWTVEHVTVGTETWTLAS